jgi:hypothetical protein
MKEGRRRKEEVAQCPIPFIKQPPQQQKKNKKIKIRKKY